MTSAACAGGSRQVAQTDICRGLIFCAYNQNPERQFAAVQQRLATEPMTDYVSPFGGGGYYFVPPTVPATATAGWGARSSSNRHEQHAPPLARRSATDLKHRLARWESGSSCRCAMWLI